MADGRVIWLKRDTKKRMEDLRGNGQTFNGFIEDLLDMWESILPDEDQGPRKKVVGKRNEREPAKARA